MALSFLVARNDAQAAVIPVPADQPTIQLGIDAASSGDTVLVAPGTYSENITFRGKAVTVTSEGGAEVTIIDGGGAGSVVSFTSGEGRGSVLNGFTVQNGRSGFDTPGFGDGGGVLINFSSPTITDNRIVDNIACNGNGIAVGFGSPLIQGNLIRGNTRAGCSGGIGGGGIAVRGASDAEITGNVLEMNSTDSFGGGISLFAASWTLVRNNIIRGNLGGGIAMLNDASGVRIIQNLIVGNRPSGGISWSNPPALVLNNTLTDNGFRGVQAGVFLSQTLFSNNIVAAAPGQTALFCDSASDLGASNFFNNDLFAPAGAAYSDGCADQTGFNGNISSDPSYACAPGGDFHLTAPSPCVDAGSGSPSGIPGADLEGNPRYVDGDGNGSPLVDIGAYEFDPSLPERPCVFITCPADIVQPNDPGLETAMVEYPPPAASPGATVTCSPSSGSAFPLGTTTVVCTTSDPEGNQASCGFQVTVLFVPANDNFDRATLIPTLPFGETLDITNATSSTDDPSCFGARQTVWYSFTPAEDVLITADTRGSNYDTTLSVFTGARDALALVACNDNAFGLTSEVRFRATAGQTYFFMISTSFFSFFPGGTLSFSVTGQPPLQVEILIDPAGSTDQESASATVTVTLRCNRPAQASLDLLLQQPLGRTRIIQGSTSLSLSCFAESPITATIFADQSFFRKGPAILNVSAFAFDPVFPDADQAQVTGVVRFRPMGTAKEPTP